MCAVRNGNKWLTWNECAVIAVEVREALWCVEYCGVTVSRDLLQHKEHTLIVHKPI